jgi:hypothetical protein
VDPPEASVTHRHKDKIVGQGAGGGGEGALTRHLVDGEAGRLPAPTRNPGTPALGLILNMVPILKGVSSVSVFPPFHQR